MSAAGTEESTATVERPRRTWSPARRAAAAQRRAARTTRPDDDSRPSSELIAEDVIGEAVANVITLAGYVMPIAPYTAVTVAGMPDPENEGEWIVRSRAEMAGSILLEHAKRNRRVLAMVARFNLLFKNIELVEVVASVAAAAAVDVHVIEPDAEMALPGGFKVPVLAPAIGDTIEYIAGQEEAARAAGVNVPRRGRRTESADGVTEPGAPWTSPVELTPEQRAQAAETRRRLELRDEAIANGTEPTRRREGQTIVPGDVTKT